MLGRKWRYFKQIFKGGKTKGPLTVTAKNHHISQDHISKNALKVLVRLQSAGFEAYLVGGGVRDMLLHLSPKDFDIVTNAHPHQIRKLFRNSRLIGRRFRLVHVYFSNEIIEVSTFRTNAEEGQPQPEMLSEDNTYGTIEEDAWRRDFTVNALYYSIANGTVADYTGGMADLKQHLLRMIGDPVQRYHEDPIRLLRAIRLSAKLNFDIHSDTKAPLLQLPHLLQHVPASRLFDEVIKLFFTGDALAVYQQLVRMDYLKVLFPDTHTLLQAHDSAANKLLIELAMQATDQRFSQGKPLNPGFLFAVLLWPVVQQLMQEHYNTHHKLYVALHHAMDVALAQQMKTLVIPRRLTAMMRSMWTLQYHLERARRSRIYRIYNQRYFRAAFDLLQLRADAKAPVSLRIVDWWRCFREGNKSDRDSLFETLES